MQYPLILAVVLYAVIALLPAQAQESHSNPKISNYAIAKALDAKRIANFPLNEDFLIKIENIRQDMTSLPAEEEVADGDNDITINGLIRAVEARPRLVAILEKHQMTANDYVIGALALANSLALITQEDTPDDWEGDAQVSNENIAFAKQYLERIRTLYAP